MGCNQLIVAFDSVRVRFNSIGTYVSTTVLDQRTYLHSLWALAFCIFVCEKRLACVNERIFSFAMCVPTGTYQLFKTSLHVKSAQFCLYIFILTKMSLYIRNILFLNLICYSTTTTQHCHPDTNRCYWVTTSTSSGWSAGRTACQSDGGDLAVMETEELFNYVLGKFRYYNNILTPHMARALMNFFIMF